MNSRVFGFRSLLGENLGRKAWVFDFSILALLNAQRGTVDDMMIGERLMICNTIQGIA